MNENTIIFTIFILGILLVSYFIYSLFRDLAEAGKSDNYWCNLIILFWLFDDD